MYLLIYKFPRYLPAIKNRAHTCNKKARDLFIDNSSGDLINKELFFHL